MSASRNKIVPTLLLGLSFVIGSGFSRGIRAQDVAPKVDEYMNAAVRAHHFSGTVLLARDGRPIVSRGYGMANFELNVANTPRQASDFHCLEIAIDKYLLTYTSRSKERSLKQRDRT